MNRNAVQDALSRLRAAADHAASAFPPVVWTRLEGPGPDTLTQDGGGGFAGLTLEPGRDVVLRAVVDAPSGVMGVPIAGQPLVATLFSLYATEITVGGAAVFADDGVPVAAGPSLFTVMEPLAAGANPAITLRLRVPPNQTTTWFQMRFTTPSLRARFEMLDVGWAQLALANALAVTHEEHAVVERAAQLVPEALPEDCALLGRLLADLAAALEPLDARVRALNVHLVGHSHIDMNWLWTWPDTAAVIKRDFRSVLQLMEEFPELIFSHSQPATYEVIRTEEPELFERVLERIRVGRWEPLTMTWVEGDVNMASGPALARQMLEAVHYSREVLGYEPSSFHSPDTFGHAGNLPQIAVSAGAARYYHHRANPGGADQWPVYWWEGQDGTRILGVSTYSYNGEINASDLAHAAMRAAKRGLPCGLHFHGIGDHGGGPSRQNLQALRRFQKMPGLPSARCSTLEAYTREVLESGVPLPEHRGESSTIFEGCYTTHADTKRFNREGENLLQTAEALAAVAGLDRREELTAAWRTVLFNQFHDIFDGSAIHEVYEKNRTDFEVVEQIAKAVTSEALDALEAGLPAGAIVVTNPLAWERDGWVSVPGMQGEGAVRLVGEHGHVAVGQYGAEGLGFVARVPALGSVAYRIDELTQPVPTLEAVPAYAPTDGRQADSPAACDAAPYLKIETPAFRVYVRRDCGVIVALYDKRDARELVGFGMRRASDYMDTARPDLGLNVFQITEEAPHAMTAWQVQEVRAEHSLIAGATTRIVESGPARCVLEVEHRARASTIVQRISFYRDLARIDFTADIDWQEPGNGEAGVPGLKAAFTARLMDCEAWYETPFAAVRRPADGQEVPVLRWADVGGPSYGIALINDSKHGYDALGCRLRLSLLRSAYDPDAIADIGRHNVRYALLPHRGDWRDAGVVQAAAGFNQPLIARKAQGADSAVASGFRPRIHGAPDVVISAVKRARDGNAVVVQMYESAGRSADAELAGIPDGASVVETNIVEDPIGALHPASGAVRLAFRPWQVRTVRVGA